MAVPFALPEDEINNLIAAVIFILSQIRLQGAQQDNRKLRESMEELVKLLAEELQRRARTSEYDNQLRQTLLLLRQSLNQFTMVSRRQTRRPNFESCCDDCKTYFHDDAATDDCSSQVGLVLGKLEDETISKESFEGEKRRCRVEEEERCFSWLVPAGVRRTLWTAVPLICIVGWHLFQISYSI